MSMFDGMTFSLGDSEGTESPQTQEPVDNGSPDSLANPFLKNIPEGEREIVAKYVKDWDAGVTQRFQKIHEEYKPYKDLGADPVTMQQAFQVYQALNSDPKAFYETLTQLMEEQEQEMAEPEVDLNSIDLDDGAKTLLRQQQLEMQALKEQMERQAAEREHEKQLAALDTLMQNLHTKHGDFDDRSVLMRISEGMSPEDAVQDYNNWVQELVSSQNKNRRPSAPVMGSGGGVPLGQVDRKTLNESSSARTSLVAQMLQARQSS